MRIQIIPVFFLSLSFATANVLAQSYAGRACEKRGNPDLKAALMRAEGLTMSGPDYGFYQDWSTSFLAPSGAVPAVVQEKPDGSNTDAVEASQERHDKWTCQHSAYSVQDADPKTAWCEGVTGDGVGEWLLVPITPDGLAKIWIGYGKSEEAFQNNGRPQKIRVHALTAQNVFLAKSTSEGSVVDGLHLSSQYRDLVLKDVNGWQSLEGLNFKSENTNFAPIVAIEILSVTKGIKYSDVCISEIKNE